MALYKEIVTKAVIGKGKKKYKNSWTKRELVHDLAEFYEQGNLITEIKY